RAPTRPPPRGRKATAEGSSAAPVSGSGSTRGPPSSSTATRLFVVPRSMPMIRPTESFSHRVFDVTEQRAQVGDLGEPALELVERRRAPVGRGVADAELVAEHAQAAREAVAQPLHLPAQLGARRRAALRVALPAFAWYRLCCLHRSREASPDQTTNEEPQPQVRFTFGLRRLKPEAISSSL